MEAATALEVASGSTPKVKEASLAEMLTEPRLHLGGGPSAPFPSSCPPQKVIHGDGEAPQDLGPDHQALKQTYIRKVGDTLNLLIPFQGKPQPQAICTHDGCALDTSHVSMWNGERDSILFIREAQRADSGHYQLRVQLGGLEATATIDTLVIGTVGGMGDDMVLGGSHPSLKRNQHREPGKRGCGTQWRAMPAAMLGPFREARLSSEYQVGGCLGLQRYPGVDSAPRHGNALLGYTVQKADTKSGLWLTALDRYHRASCTVSNLIVGNSYALRVFAENQCGLSQTASVTADLAHIQRADFSEAPKFSQPLADCTTVIGCDTQLFCCVHAYPKPKTIWLKNKMDIQGNPKYRALIHLGICSLEIHKPGPFDGGIYTCKAVNPLGEASVDCRVDVKGKGRTRTLGCNHLLSPQVGKSRAETQA
ncbi:hypothetical protein E2I00_010865 [Balaenoptera physalus]|uniref:Myosin-binding protein H-like n=1 Tax=Balaenoptera physalus TaxID=9770 RepID=A0A643BYM6_BALPH|nr:hypothetical protein E2I00_010865 [Balaenoptera physalus]